MQVKVGKMTLYLRGIGNPLQIQMGGLRGLRYDSGLIEVRITSNQLLVFSRSFSVKMPPPPQKLF